MTDNNAHDIVVVGAGIIGISTALALQAQGRPVLVLDRDDGKAKASEMNAGAFAFTDIVPLATPGIMSGCRSLVSSGAAPVCAVGREECFICSSPMVQMPVPITKAAKPSLNEVRRRLLAVNTATPTTRTQTRKESSVGRTRKSTPSGNLTASIPTKCMRPVVKALADESILVSVETYHPEVGVALLEAGAGVVNVTGRIDDPAFYEAVALHQAGVVLCYTPGENARSEDYLPPAEDIFDHQLTFFKERISLATNAGVERLWVDPGFGFALHLPDGPDRIRYQTDSILQSFRLRELGWPVTVQLTGAVYLFRDEVRVAQTSAATIAVFSKANLVRSHEVSRVQPVLNLQEFV